MVRETYIGGHNLFVQCLSWIFFAKQGCPHTTRCTICADQVVSRNPLCLTVLCLYNGNGTVRILVYADQFVAPQNLGIGVAFKMAYDEWSESIQGQNNH